jgi:hypothetical protein
MWGHRVGWIPRDCGGGVRCLWNWTYTSLMSVGEVPLTLILMDTYITLCYTLTIWIGHYMRLLLTK